MGRVFVEHLSGKAYCCKYCHTHLAKVDELLSKVSIAANAPNADSGLPLSLPAVCVTSTSCIML
jgi:hypothetical protein